MTRFYDDTSQTQQRAKKLTALAAAAKKAADLVETANRSGNLQAEALAHAAQALTQMTGALEEVRDLDRAETARRHRSRERERRAHRGFAHGMRRLMGQPEAR